ncbi:hypothetical protein K523DRAFT_357595 [Schizophyllum commune Tattone D]|nr:hypothetical protein K523DRAFT_357595 [Schizophyllum commune Tattone D]
MPTDTSLDICESAIAAQLSGTVRTAGLAVDHLLGCAADVGSIVGDDARCARSMRVAGLRVVGDCRTAIVAAVAVQLAGLRVAGLSSPLPGPSSDAPRTSGASSATMRDARARCASLACACRELPSRLSLPPLSS